MNDFESFKQDIFIKKSLNYVNSLIVRYENLVKKRNPLYDTHENYNLTLPEIKQRLDWLKRYRNFMNTDIYKTLKELTNIN